jgi:hypothetical protein
MSDLPDPTPIDRLIDGFALSGIPVDAGKREEMKQRFRQQRFLIGSLFRCPSYTGTNPFQPVPGQGMVYNFDAYELPFNYTLVILDVTDDPATIVFETTVQFFTSPCQFNIPAMTGGANTFRADRNYVFLMYASLRLAGVVVPYACISSVPKTTVIETFEMAVFTALDGPLSPPCGG